MNSLFKKIIFPTVYAKYNSLNCYAFHLPVLCEPDIFRVPS